MAADCKFQSGRKNFSFAIPLAFIVAVGFGLSGPALADTSDQLGNGQADYHPLQGGVEHDEHIAPVSPDLERGKVLDAAALMNVTPDNNWFPIPSWFAGTWHSEEERVLYLKDLQSGQTDTDQRTVKEVSDAVYGTQTDKTGQIWNYVKIPRTVKMKLSRGSAYQLAKQEDPIQTDGPKVVLKYLYDEIDVNNKDKITTVNQLQTINTYTQVEDGLVRLSASVKSFDGAGNGKVLQKGEKLAKRTVPYAPVDKDGDLDLKKMFIEFLTKTGRQDLIPNG